MKENNLIRVLIPENSSERKNFRKDFSPSLLTLVSFTLIGVCLLFLQLQIYQNQQNLEELEIKWGERLEKVVQKFEIGKENRGEIIRDLVRNQDEHISRPFATTPEVRKKRDTVPETRKSYSRFVKKSVQTRSYRRNPDTPIDDSGEEEIDYGDEEDHIAPHTDTDRLPDLGAYPSCGDKCGSKMTLTQGGMSRGQVIRDGGTLTVTFPPIVQQQEQRREHHYSSSSSRQHTTSGFDDDDSSDDSNGGVLNLGGGSGFRNDPDIAKILQVPSGTLRHGTFIIKGSEGPCRPTALADPCSAAAAAGAGGRGVAGAGAGSSGLRTSGYNYTYTREYSEGIPGAKNFTEETYTPIGEGQGQGQGHAQVIRGHQQQGARFETTGFRIGQTQQSNVATHVQEFDEEDIVRQRKLQREELIRQREREEEERLRVLQEDTRREEDELRREEEIRRQDLLSRQREDEETRRLEEIRRQALEVTRRHEEEELRRHEQQRITEYRREQGSRQRQRTDYYQERTVGESDYAYPTTTTTTTRRPYYPVPTTTESAATAARGWDYSYNYHTTTESPPIHDHSYYQQRQRQQQQTSHLSSTTYQQQGSSGGVNVRYPYPRQEVVTEPPQVARPGSTSCRGIVPIAAHFLPDSSPAATPQYSYSSGGESSTNLTYVMGTFRWRYSDWMASRFEQDIRPNFVISSDGRITVRRAGLYYIYAQVYYEDYNTLDSFLVEVNSEPWLKCKEASCHTSGLRYLAAEDVLLVRDGSGREKSAFFSNLSFLGLMNVGGVCH